MALIASTDSTGNFIGVARIEDVEDPKEFQRRVEYELAGVQQALFDAHQDRYGYE